MGPRNVQSLGQSCVKSLGSRNVKSYRRRDGQEPPSRFDGQEPPSRFDGQEPPSRRNVPMSGQVSEFEETILTHQSLPRALQPEATRIIGSDELRSSVTLKLVASVHLCAFRVSDLSGFDGDSVGGSSRLRVVTTDLTFVHYLSLDWLDCPGLLMSGGARDGFSLLNRAKNNRAIIAGQSNWYQKLSHSHNNMLYLRSSDHNIHTENSPVYLNGYPNRGFCSRLFDWQSYFCADQRS